MPLPNLIPAGGQIAVQNTTFSVDALGRYVCSTWDEATANGGAPFSAVVVGAGMYGAYCATKIFRRHPGKRVLLLDAGRFLVSEHVQNLAQIGLNVPSAIAPSSDPGVARELVWGIPWRGNVEFPGLAYCTGGKSIYWGGWCPTAHRRRLAGLARFGRAVSQRALHRCRERDRRRPGDGLHLRRSVQYAEQRSRRGRSVVRNIETTIGNNGVEAAPLAVQGSAPESGLFSFDKYSSLPLLVEAIRDAVALLGRERREPPALPRAAGARRQAPRRRRRGSHHRGGCRRPTQVPADRPAVRGDTRQRARSKARGSRCILFRRR